MSVIEIRTAGPQELRKVLRMTLATAGQSAAELEGHVTAFLRYAREMSLDLSRHWLCHENGRKIAACTCIESPGRTAMLFLPDGRAGSASAAVIPELVLHVIREESKRDVRLLQCFLDPNDREGRRALEFVGFFQVAELIYMERPVADLTALAPAEEAKALGFRGATWFTYDKDQHDRFASLIEASYRDSLDCRGLTEIRDIEDVIRGHKAAGRFVPARWLMLCGDDRPLGCILLCENPLQPVLELVYMGVHPEFRRRGIAGHLLWTGLQLAHREGFDKVTMAVDSVNEPALTLYRRFGFSSTMRRTAMIRVINSNSSGG